MGCQRFAVVVVVVDFLLLSELPLQQLANKLHLIIKFPHSLAVKYGFAKANSKP